MRQRDNPCRDQSGALYWGLYLHLGNKNINLRAENQNVWGCFVVVNVLLVSLSFVIVVVVASCLECVGAAEL